MNVKEEYRYVQECKYKRGDILLRIGCSKMSGYCYLVHDVKDGYLYLDGLGMIIHYTMVPFYFEEKPYVPEFYRGKKQRKNWGTKFAFSSKSINSC